VASSHAVTQTGDYAELFCYDAVGRLKGHRVTVPGEGSFDFTSTSTDLLTAFATSESSGGVNRSSEFWYGPNRNRYKQIALNPTQLTNETTTYVAGLFEKRASPTAGTLYHMHVFADGQHRSTLQWYGGWAFSPWTLRRDATDNVVPTRFAEGGTEQSFDAFGRRRNASSWRKLPRLANSVNWTLPAQTGDADEEIEVYGIADRRDFARI
jgi:hypothetical protein